VDDNAQRLGDVFRLPAQPRGLARRLADKSLLYRLCEQHGAVVPVTVMPRRREELEEILRVAAFPVILKNSDPVARRPENMQLSTMIARDRVEALAVFEATNWQVPNILVQECLPDGPEYRWVVSAYVDRKGDCAVACTGRKLREHPPGAGCTALGVCEENRPLQREAVRFLDSVGYRGIADLDYRLDPRDGRFKLLDLNPRQGANFRLFGADNGMDVVRAMYLDLTDQPVPPCRPRDGRRWAVEPFDLWASARYFDAGELSLGAWLRSYRGVEELAWLNADDPVPAIYAAGEFARSIPPLLGAAAVRVRHKAARRIHRPKP